MTTLSCEEVADLAAELALDALPGDQRASVLEHLAGCTTCRHLVEQLAETADALLSAHGLVEPPPGFEERTLAAMQGTVSPRPSVSPGPSAIAPLRRQRRPRPVVLAAAAAVFLAVMAGGGATLSARRGPSDPTVEAAGQQMRTVQLISTSGQAVGDVSAYAGSPVWIFMRVSHGRGSGTFECVLDLTGGATVSLGTMSLSSGRGGWGEHIAIDVHRIVRARVVASTGETIASATFR